MSGERQGPKSSGYGGFLQLFDWNAKSRKKLFSSISDFPDHPGQQKKSEGNFPTTRIRMLDEDEIGATARIKGSSDYSCASSVTDEEGYASKAPGVVARLMGLDSLPTTSNAIEPYSSPFFDTQSLNEALFRKIELQYIYEVHQKSIRRPIEKFQTENLPPKSAKSIPITQHKLLSPIKKPGFVQYNDVAHIMEAAARIIEPGPQVSTSRTRISSSGSSSVPLKVRELKEKMAEVSKRPPLESNAAKSLKGQPLSNSGHSSASTKSKGKSINLAIQAKVNVQRREGLNPSLNNIEGRKEDNKVAAHKKMSVRNSSQVLRQNTQKQNCSSGKENVPCTNVHGGKAVSGDSRSSRGGSKKSSLEGRDNQKNVSQSGQRNVPRKKRIIDGGLQGSRNEKTSQSNSVKEADYKGADVVSFTFSTRMKESNSIFSDNISEEFTLCQENVKLASPGYDVVSESLSFLLEQKLRELTDGTELSNCSSTTIFGGSLHDKNVEHELQMKTQEEYMETYDQNPSSFSSTELENPRRIYGKGGEMDECSSSKAKTRLLYNRRHPSPVSILDSSDDLTESCNSTDSTGSNMTKESKQQCSSENPGLSDSASSSKGEIPELPAEWELDYIKDILSNVELMLKDYATGRTREIINPHLFDQMERKRGSSISYKDAPLVEKKGLFDCVRECLDWRCQRFIGGGLSAWEKGLALVRNKERLVEDVYKEIQEWRMMRNCMVDDLIDKDMSIVHGRWLDFEADEFVIAVDVETQILDSLVAEVAAQILGVRQQRSSTGYTSFLSTL